MLLLLFCLFFLTVSHYIALASLEFYVGQADLQLNSLKEAWPPGTVAHAFNHSTPEAEASVSLRVQDQPRIHIKLQVSQSYIARPCLKTDELSITDLGCSV